MKLHIVFLGLAALLATVWGSVELIVAVQGDSENLQACNLKKAVTTWRNTQWINSDSKGIWVFDRKSGKIELRRPARTEAGKVSHFVDREYALICETPDFQCFVAPDSKFKNEVSVELVHFPYALVKVPSRPDALFPVQFFPGQDSKWVTRSPPIHFCSQPIDFSKMEFQVVGQRLVGIYKEGGVLGFWELKSFRGGTYRDAGRGVSEIWKLNEFGDLNPSTCAEFLKPVTARIAFAGEAILAHVDVATNSEFKLWELGTSVSPISASEIQLRGLYDLRSQKGQAVSTVYAKEASLHVLNKNKWQIFPEERRNLVYRGVLSGNEEDFLLIAARKYLSSLSLRFLQGSKVFSIPWEDFQINREQLPEFRFFSGEGLRLIGEMQGSDAQIHELSCPTADPSISTQQGQ